MNRRSSILAVTLLHLSSVSTMYAQPTVEERLQELLATAQTGEFSKGLEISREILERTNDGSALPPESLVLLDCFTGVAKIELGQIAAAEVHVKRALELSGKLTPPNLEFSLFARQLRLKWLIARADVQTAMDEARSLMAESASALGSESMLTVTTEMVFGLAAIHAGKLDEAESVLSRALPRLQSIYGAESPFIAYAITNLSMAQIRLGKLSEAKEHLKNAVAILEKAGWVDRPAAIIVYGNLGYLAIQEQRFDDARKFLTMAIDVARRNGAENNPGYHLALSNLAVVDRHTGNLSSAEKSVRSVVEANRRMLGDSPQLGLSLANLGEIYSDMNDDKRSEACYTEAAEIYARLPGYRGADFSGTMQILARKQAKRKRYALAEQTAIRAYRISRSVSSVETIESIDALFNLAKIYYDQDLYDRARPLFERVLSTRERLLGPEHTDVGWAASWLGDIAYEQRDYATAGRYYDRRAEIFVRTFGPDSSELSGAHLDLAWNCLALRERDKALTHFRAFEAAKREVAEQILSFTSEEQRLRYLGDINLYNLYGTLGSAPDLARVVLRTKSLALDTVLEDRALRQNATGPQVAARIDEIAAAKNRLIELSLSDGGESSSARARKSERQRLLEQIEVLEASLGREFREKGAARMALRVEPSAVQGALPEDASLVEFISYKNAIPGEKGHWAYGAVILNPKGDPQWIDLGAAKPIDEAIRIYKIAARGNADETALEGSLRSLGASLWDPIAALLPSSTKRVIISPDDDLHYVSFATLLLGDGSFACEQKEIAYVASGRDLLRSTAARAAGECVVFSNPDFSASGTPPVATGSPQLASARTRGFDGVEFLPLPGTVREQNKLSELATRAGWESDTFTHGEATEEALRNVRGPAVLHLATHGFFIESEKKRDEDKEELSANPMFRSGLALAGASDTLARWRRGEMTPATRDGIITAAEVAEFSLRGTWLVTLSACETGSGETDSREGLLGLRRGFAQAGAQNIVMTLWPIADELTVEIMVKFYEHAFATGNAAQSLAVTQREWLVKLRKEQGLLAAVNAAGPFILSFQGKP